MESQYYRPADLPTAKYLEDRLGLRSAFARSKTLHHASDSSSEGLAERPISLLTAQAIAQLKDNEIIGFHRNGPPFRAKRMDWRPVSPGEGDVVEARKTVGFIEGIACPHPEAEPTSACFFRSCPRFKVCRRLSGRKSRGDARTLILIK